MPLDRWVPEDNDIGRGMDEGRGQQDSEEIVPILPTGWMHMEALEEEKRHPAPSDDEERGTGGISGSVVGVVVVRAANSRGLKLRGVEETFIRIMRRCHRD